MTVMKTARKETGLISIGAGYQPYSWLRRKWEEGVRQSLAAYCLSRATSCGYTRAPSPSTSHPLPLALCLLLTSSLLIRPAAAQHPPDTTDVDIAVEAILEDLGEALGDPAQLAERLDELRLHPLDVNTASAEELAQIPALSLALARQIVLYRTTTGPYATLDALRAVEGMTETVLQAARPYLTAGSSGERAPAGFSRLFENLQGEWIQRAGRRLDLGKGYDDDTTHTTYAGSPDRFYTRLRVRSQRHFRLNLTLEKDPGEPFAWDPASGAYGFDHVTASVALHDLGPLKTLVVGDFVANFGQGVMLWRSSAFGKGRETVRPLVRAGQGLVPYGSTDENRFFRGVAGTIRLAPGLSTSVFASRRALDATVTEVDTTDAGAFGAEGAATGFSESGLHRTLTERSKKDAVREDLMGGNVEVRRGGGVLGVAGYHSRFDRPVRPGEAPYQRYQFGGQQATMIGAYGRVFLGAMHLFGEAARSQDAFGGIGGLTVRLTNRAEAVMLARHYPRDFVSLHGYAFGERNGETTNETGYYVGLQINPGPAWRLAAFFDQYRFPWVRFGVPRPSTGYEVFFVIEHRPRRWLTVYLQGRSETKETGIVHTDSGGRLLDAVRPETRQSLRLHGDYRFSPRLRLRARLEATRFAAPDAADAYGLVLYQDVRWRPINTVQVDLRLAFFDTDTFETRVFTYENDLLYTFSVPAFSGRGQRAYALVQWTPTPRLTLQAKAAMTQFEDALTVGSGLDEVEGNRLREVRAQLRWRF